MHANCHVCRTAYFSRRRAANGTIKVVITWLTNHLQNDKTFDRRDEFSVDIADFYLRHIENTNASGRECQCTYKVDPITNTTVNRTFRQCG